MSFASPWALLWGLLAAPIIIFYILKIRLRRVPVSSVIFWNQIFEEKQARSIWQRLRHLLSLLIQLCFLGLLVFALADPFFSWEVRDARRIVVILDNSASMNASDVQPTRLEKARATVNGVIDSLRMRDEMAVVAAGTQPKVVCGLTGHQQTLRGAIQSVESTDGPTRVADAAKLARRLLAGHENGQILLLTDGCFQDAAETLEAEDVTWFPVGERPDNVGITAFQVRRSLIDPIGYEILTVVETFGEEPVELRLELELDDEVVDVLPLELEPGKPWKRVFQKTSAEGGTLLARLDRDDVLETDNTAQAILPKRERQKVILVTPGNLFLERVFEANVLADVEVVAELPESIPNGATVVFHRDIPEKLPNADVVVVEPSNATALWKLHEKLDQPLVAEQDKDSPLMAHVRLDNVLMPEAYRVEPTTEAHTLVESAAGDPLYFSIDRPDGSVLVLTVNLDKSDLPLRTAFPILMSNALSWFSGAKGELREALATGDVAEVELPPELLPTSNQQSSEGEAVDAGTSPVLVAPDGTRSPLAVGDSATVTIGPLNRCGIWRIAPADYDDQSAATSEAQQGQPAEEQAVVQLACNLASSSESDLRAPETKPEQQPIATAGFAGRPIWFYLIAAAWLLIAAEWFLYQRRWIA